MTDKTLLEWYTKGFKDELWGNSTVESDDELEKEGAFEIKNDSVFIFEQGLRIQSSRVVFDEKGIHSGKIYTCTDGSYFYTILLTKQLELFLYVEEKLLKFILWKKQD